MPYVLIGLGVAIFLFIALCIRIVPQGYSWVTELLGKYKSTWDAGLHFKIPLFERVASKVILKECTLDYEPQAVITKDNVTMQVDTVVFFKVIDPRLFSYGAEDPLLALKSLTSTTLRNVIGELDFDETLTSRDVINGKMTVTLDEVTDPWGIKITRVELKSIEPPADIRDAMTKQMKAERERRETILEAEAHQKAVVTRAEGDKQAIILTAQAERDAEIARAEGQAKSIELVYQAEARGIRMLNDSGISPQVLSLKGIESLKDIANGNSTKIFMPSEISNLVSLAGVFSEASGVGSAMPINPKPTPVMIAKDPCCDEPERSKVTQELVKEKTALSEQ